MRIKSGQKGTPKTVYEGGKKTQKYLILILVDQMPVFY